MTDVGPASLHETLVRRLSWLPAETNELLRFASLLGSSFTMHDVATITGRAVIDVAGWLREAALAGLVVGDGDRLTFRHDLVREAVYGHMLPAERRDLHLAAGRALANTTAPVQQVAEQYARGAVPGDLEAVGWLRRAADDAAVDLAGQRHRAPRESSRARPARLARTGVTAGGVDRTAGAVRPVRRRPSAGRGDPRLLAHCGGRVHGTPRAQRGLR